MLYIYHSYIVYNYTILYIYVPLIIWTSLFNEQIFKIIMIHEGLSRTIILALTLIGDLVHT